MKSLGAIGISGAGLNTAIGKAPSHSSGIVFESSLIGRSKGEPVRTKQVPKNGLNRKSEHVEDSSYSSTA